jgi:hypothetical protein
MKLLVLFTHLLSTCLALGVILLTDIRLLGRMMGYRVVIPPPSRFDTRIVMAALPLLCLSGGMLVFWGLQDRPDYLLNPKLQVKVSLVGLLVANAFVLHRWVFPVLERGLPLAQWTPRQFNLVAVSVGLSNSLWLYCAFLGIARPWNFAVVGEEVLLVGAGLWVVVAVGLRLLLVMAARDEPMGEADWIDSIKASLAAGSTPGSPRPFQDTAPAKTDVPEPAVDILIPPAAQDPPEPARFQRPPDPGMPACTLCRSVPR